MTISTASDEKPLVGITMGDPAGVGPEIVVKALTNRELYDVCLPVVIGVPAPLERAASILGAHVDFNLIDVPSAGRFRPGTIDVVPAAHDENGTVEFGKVQAAAGRMAYECIRLSSELGLEKAIDAVATAPINKESIKAAGIPFIGHTEMYASMTGASFALTMFTVRNLRVFFLTRHLSLADAIRAVTKERVYETLKQVSFALRDLGFSKPRIAVAGLNPHSGEGGLFGYEEIREIAPAIEQARADGIDACGPVSADTVFHLGLEGKWDAILSLYHDQGHIATKTLDFERTVSVTLGLPFLRTSVDHGTAFDIAGRGVASAVSMEEAIRVAARYSHVRRA
ncbi:MAG: 4-hydroxythreonine-4-phosphate dehydrogenase PdxA [Firmicutes bacterium]|jgi:4-hydroxythreonine-4-phosphate dehydrogenase|nr:4-hydroxythreonine-4-phosphate dehydrogenase PdxA [Bacillota bacterium]MDH7496737.1 4-hydroxythreonine-4-phosphate dehydrogenase PdxA [Bacillota bacterium]